MFPKNNLLFFFIIIVYQFGNTQSLKKQTLGNQGASHFVYTNNKSYYILESIGQASVTHTFNANNYSLRQGYLQPVSASLISIDSNTDIEAVIFPNPFSSKVEVKFKKPIIDILQVTLRDVLGRIILNKQFSPMQSIVLNLNNLNTGTYLIQIRMRSKLLNAKIIKR
ncbi:T9SS type A sorting domain-containing protein [Flavivirga jejuensis]|uniref:T9SS type A sorting domain-containing protein n=1 Tax=Flavivirga jejuensis TaxID=870487 RepID=A0ABT8WSP5_9FLAO|nr:T9SS type A sorting domain-containing protein [Flavivirga jejuensis]MDO5975882.1 T9SS type A sorting domain-containing protein [Flavivirga jejuensis]